MQRKPPAKHKRHLGLQTKVASIIIVSLLASMLGTTIANYYQVQQYHKDSVTNNLIQLESILTNIAQRSGSYLERLASQIALPETATSGDQSPIPFEPSLFSGIDSINVISADGDYLLRWSLPGVTQTLPRKILQETANDILQSGRPINRLYCDTSCLHSVFIPQIDSRGEEIIINANLSLVDLVRDFKAITGADIAFFKQHHWEDAQDHSQYTLISSAPEKTQKILDELSLQPKLLQTGGFYLGNTSEGYFAVKRVQLEPPVSFGNIDVVMFSDESQTYAFIQKSFENGVTSSAITLLVAALILVVVLQLPINRILVLSRALPSLAKQEFGTVKDSVEKARNNIVFPDEIDTLAEAVGNATDALQNLNNEVQARSRELEEKIQELQEAQHFNQVLVDGSPLAIITFSEDGKLRSFNQYARHISGLSDDSPGSLSIDQLIMPDDAGRSIFDIIALINRSTQKVQSEQPLASTGNKSHVLNWIHTRLEIDKEHCYLSVGLDITETRESEERMRWLSKHDHITGLLNRSTFTLDAGQAIDKMRDGERATLLIFDIDDFSTLNDRFGLHIGDLILEQTSRYLVEHLPQNALVSRTGSNEFSALLVGEEAVSAPLESINHFHTDLENLSLDIVLTGVSLHYPTHGENIDELLANGTDAMHRSKQKNRGTMFEVLDTSESRNLRQEKLALREQLLSAFDQNRFVLFYQPIYHLASQSISHCECLIRLLGEDGRFISPGMFLGVAKEFNLMPQLDRHVIKMAMQQQARWAQQGRDLKLSINVTPSTFQTENFQNELQELIQQTGAQGDHLIFEIVETEALENMSFAQTIAEELTAIGAELAFDDFGIGFTSFEYLRELPVNYVKIDQSFVRYLDQREKDQLLVKSMVDMSLALGKKIIAEGVENRESFDLLADMGVHYIQGYFVAHPTPESELDFGLKIN